eukprot:TRINITY_DN83220_c0_g1_i1.p1 TRINITY_DN83220_c0_g1~~TRINITY_DN83220_c0_g1_i1.p1  ORF type:complete len:327 (+),score=25.31 TRINITY_DN83220_c0_g1_i1:61-1041(+)
MRRIVNVSFTAGRMSALVVQTLGLVYVTLRDPYLDTRHDGWQAVPNISTFLANGIGVAEMFVCTFIGTGLVMVDLMRSLRFAQRKGLLRWVPGSLPHPLPHDGNELAWTQSTAQTTTEVTVDTEEILMDVVRDDVVVEQLLSVNNLLSLITWIICNFAVLVIVANPICRKTWLTTKESPLHQVWRSDKIHSAATACFFVAPLFAAIANSFRRGHIFTTNLGPTDFEGVSASFTTLFEAMSCVAGVAFLLFNGSAQDHGFQHGRLFCLLLEVSAILLVLYAGAVRLIFIVTKEHGSDDVLLPGVGLGVFYTLLVLIHIVFYNCHHVV